MKKIFLSAAFVLAMVLAFSFTVGADEGEVQTKFYDFDEMLIDGGIKRPSGTLIDVRDRVRFERLLQLDKSFIPELEQSGKEQALK